MGAHLFHLQPWSVLPGGNHGVLTVSWFWSAAEPSQRRTPDLSPRKGQKCHYASAKDMGFAEKIVKETSEIALSCVPRARMVRKINHSFIPKTVGSRDRLQEASLHVCDQKSDCVLYFKETKPAGHTDIC